MRKIYSRNTAKNLTHFTNFPANMFLVGVRKSICTAPFLKAKELHFRSTWKASVCIFEYIPVRKFLFQWHRKLLSGGDLNNFVKAVHCLKCFKIVHFNLVFWKFNYLSAFPYFRLQHWNAEIFQIIWISRVRLWLNFS